MSRLRRGLATMAVCAVSAGAVVALPVPALAAETGVRINEVESSGGTPGDWIELYNPGDAPIDVSGYGVMDSDQRDATIPAGTTIAAHGYIVLDEKDGFGNFGFGLGAADEVRLFDIAGTLVDERSWTSHATQTFGVREGVDPQWQETLAATKGAANSFASESVETVEPGQPSDSSEPNPPAGQGEPAGQEEPAGQGAPASTAGVVVNEIVYDTASGVADDSIELYNAGAGAIDLSGYRVADDKRNAFGVIPEGTSLAPGAFLVLTKGADFPFGLGKGDEVVLFDADGAVVDDYAYAGTAPLAVWARCPDGTGDWAPATAATLGAANVCAAPATPGRIVLNEVDSSPADWIEFVNPGTAAVDVSGYEIRDNSDDHRWRFPAGASIAGGSFLVVEADTAGLAYRDTTDEWVPDTFASAIGIGGADSIRLYDTGGALIDETGAWTTHAAIDGDEAAATLARCPDGVGAFLLGRTTKGAPNACVLPDVAINEIESNGDVTDWVEVVNRGTTAVDISGWSVMDSDPVGHATQATPLPAGTLLAPGGFFVFDQPANFVFGLGNGDTVTVRDQNGNAVDEYVYTAHAAGVWARCPDGTGDFADVAEATKGAANCGAAVRINEVESNDGTPGDWIELVNPNSDALDVSGIVVKDDDDAHAYTIPAGTSIPGKGYLVIEQSDLGFGLGADDAVRLFDGGALIDSTAWGTAHAAVTWARCPDVTGEFHNAYASTKGAANVCEAPPVSWPGAAEVRVLDQTPMFLGDSSGLDTQVTSEGSFLWAVDNGTGRFFRLAVAADGSVSFVPGWENGKRARFQKDAAAPTAAGPDAEGITVAGDGFIYLASERDNSAKGVNQNKILKLDPNAAGPDVIASQEWDLTALLPAVAANVGLEAVEWVADADLVGALWDTGKNKAYDPADYPGHGGGLFFVAVEDKGQVFAFALTADGGATKVATVDPGLGGAMALDWDAALHRLWVVCDNGCQGEAALIDFTGAPAPAVTHVSRPAGMPNLNNEGFATLPAAVGGGATRPAWWFADGESPGALRLGSLPAVDDSTNPDPGSGGTTPGTGPGTTPGTGTGATPGTGTGATPGTGTGALPGTVQPLPGDALTAGNRGDVSGPASARPGALVTLSVGTRYAGVKVEVWMYSTPVRVGAGTIDATGRISVALPADAATGTHRVVVYAADGTILGWTSIEVTGTSASAQLAATGSDAPGSTLLWGALLLVLGGAAVLVRRRATR